MKVLTKYRALAQLTQENSYPKTGLGKNQQFKE
jgi:hypothetical protein